MADYRSSKALIIVVFIVLVALGFSERILPAATALFWDPTATNSSTGGGMGTWNTASWWNGASDAGWVTGDDASFGGTAGSAVTLSDSVIVHNLLFSTTGYTVSGSTLTLTGGTINAAENATIRSVLAGN
ncbi:MAG: hypothetical protein ABSG53_31795, partial [Thermoguttaceae bacterium]